MPRRFCKDGLWVIPFVLLWLLGMLAFDKLIAHFASQQYNNHWLSFNVFYTVVYMIVISAVWRIAVYCRRQEYEAVPAEELP